MSFADILHDALGVDLDAVAQQTFDRRPSISCTPSCRGCSDPQCGYCEAYEEAVRPQRVAAEAEKIIADGRALRELFVDLEWENPDAVAGILRAAVTGDYIKSGERIRNLLTPKINELAERQA